MTDVDGITHWVSQNKLRSIGAYMLHSQRAHNLSQGSRTRKVLNCFGACCRCSLGIHCRSIYRLSVGSAHPYQPENHSFPSVCTGKESVS